MSRLPQPDTREPNHQPEWAANFSILQIVVRCNLTDEERTYMIGKQYEADKHSEAFHGNQYTSGRDRKCLHQNETSGPNKTAKAVARQHGVGETTVKQSEKFAKGVDTAETI